MSLMALAIRVGLDADFVAQVVAASCAAVFLLLIERRLPRTLVGALPLLAVVGWAPFAHWATIGMETTFYCLLLALGWRAAATPERWGTGIALLGAATLTRPEGVLHLVAALLLGWRSPVRGRGLAVGSLVGLALYHTVRIAWFGHAIPTSYLVKVSPIGLTPFGAVQLLGDLLTAAGILVALLVTGRVEGRRLFVVCLPLAIQGATLVRASGDWMAWGRIVAPGILTSSLLYSERAKWRDAVSRPVFGMTTVAVVTGSLLEPHGYGSIDLRLRNLTAVARSVGHLRHGLDTPVAEDVAWVIDNVPPRARMLVVDAGILGDVPSVHLLDARGLSHRPAAEAIAAGRPEAWMRALIADPAHRPEFLRLANWEGVEHPEYPDWLIGPYTLRADLRYGGGSIRWYADGEKTPDPEQRAARWAEMLRRHPSQPFLWWHAALSAAEAGDSSRASVLAAEAARRWPTMAEFGNAPESLSFTTGTSALTWHRNRGFLLKPTEEISSRSLQAGERYILRLESDQETRGVLLDDPCEPDGRAFAGPGTTELIACGAPRAVSLRAVGPDPVFVSLVISEEPAQ